jgi:pimeloyl-ACP methyl ester carboxylesterase
MTNLAETAKTEVTIRPFEVHLPDEELVDLRRRITATRWPDKETVTDDSQGVPLAMMRELAGYWATDYNWRRCEAKLNALPQFMTEIDGLDVHFIHVRSQHEQALPLIVTHGWPGSVIELLEIVDPLTNPTAHGASASDAFHLVIPSLPGFGFSSKPTTTGWDPARVARAWAVLMTRLGYKHFVSQGGDFGAVVSDRMAEQQPSELLGIHSNFPATVPPGPPSSELSADERRAYQQLNKLRTKHLGYAIEMGTRPQTVGYSQADSPVGLAALMLDHGDSAGQPGAAITAALLGPTGTGDAAGELTRDDILDNVTLYWLTNTGPSAARIFWENKVPLLSAVNVSIPTAISVFPGEIYQAPRSWAEQAYHNLIYFHEVDKGGHFAAWEQPELFSSELRAAFRALR